MVENIAVQTLLEQCRSYESQGELALAWKCARQAQAQASKNNDRARQAQALLQMARMEYLQGHSTEAAAYAQEALATAEPETPEIVRAWMILGNSAALGDDRNRAEECYRKALDLARLFGTPAQRQGCLHNLANGIYAPRGQFDLALSHELESFRLSQQYNLEQGRFLNYITLSQIYLLTGRFEAARQLSADWQAQEPISEADFGYRCVLLAVLALADGDPQRALDLYQQSLGRAEMIGEPGWLATVYEGISECRRQMNDPASALDWSNQALSLSRRNNNNWEGVGLALVERARAFWMSGNLESAQADLQEALESLERGGITFERARAALLLAALLRQIDNDRTDAVFLDAGRSILAGGFLYLLDAERPLALPLLAQHLDSPDPEIACLAGELLQALAQFPPAPLRVHTLGWFSVQIGARKLAYADLRQRRSGELLALLLSTPGCSLTAEQASEALAPESDPETGRGVVYKAVFELRRALEPELPDRRFASRYLDSSDGRLTLRLPPSSWIDFQCFQQAIQKGDLEGALALYSGEYLAEYRYADWAAWLRESLAQDYQDTLLHLAERAGAAADWSKALELARRVVRLDPWNETAALIAMQAHQSMGDIPAAQRVYRKLQKALLGELGLAPGEKIQQFAQSLKKRC